MSDPIGWKDAPPPKASVMHTISAYPVVPKNFMHGMPKGAQVLSVYKYGPGELPHLAVLEEVGAERVVRSFCVCQNFDKLAGSPGRFIATFTMLGYVFHLFEVIE